MPATPRLSGFLVALALVLPVLSGCVRRAEIGHDATFATQVQSLDGPPGVADAVWTLIGGRVTVLGTAAAGAEAPVLAWQLDPATGRWAQPATLGPGLRPKALFWSAAGVLVPAVDPSRQYVWLSRSASGRIEARSLPALPEAPAPAAAAMIGGQLFVATSTTGAMPANLFSTVVDGAAGWTNLGPIGGPGYEVLALSSQSDGARPNLFVLSRREADLRFASFEPERRTWRELPQPAPALSDSTLAPVGIAHLYAFGPGATPSSSGLRVFNTITRVWTPAFALPAAGGFVAAVGSGPRVQALAVDPRGRATLLTADYLKRANGLHPADYAVIATFLSALVLMGLVNSARFRSAESYFRGGRKIPWLAAGLSVVATGQSATSFISLPARAFATNWQFGLIPLTNVFGALIMGRYFVRFFVRLNITSAYEYLQIRFSPLVRTIGSINYLAYELTRISLLILVPAVAVSAVTKLDIGIAILLMGAIATLYTTLGGLEGVVWADVVQILVKITAIILVVVLVFAQLEGSLWELAGTAWREGKLRAVDWSFDLTRDTIWALLLFWLTDGLKSYVANQTIIQRFISTRDERTARRSIYASAVAGTLIFWTFLLAGTGLFLFYQQNPGRLDLTMDKPDAVFPWYIVFELPAGIAGFLITALITAALSSLYGALNSTSTVMVTDFYRRFAAAPTDAGALRLGRRLTIVVGVVATGLSLLLAGLASRSLVEQTLSVIGLFGGGLGGLFLVGMLTTRVGPRAALAGFFTSAVVQYIVSRHTPLHWLTYMFTGMGSCFLASWVASLAWRENRPLEGLTVHTCSR